MPIQQVVNNYHKNLAFLFFFALYLSFLNTTIVKMVAIIDPRAFICDDDGRFTLRELLENKDVKYVYGRAPDQPPQINQWPLSHNVDGWEIRTNPATGAQLHYDQNGKIYKMHISESDDTSLDGIVTTSANEHNENTNLDGKFTLMVSECSPVFIEGPGIEFSIYTKGHIHSLFNEGGVMHANAPNFIIQMDL
jgi:hypothetical protein